MNLLLILIIFNSLAIMIWYIQWRKKPYYTKRNLPIISFQQFCSLYPLASEKWKYMDNGYEEEWLEYTAIEENPNYDDELINYSQERKMYADIYNSWRFSSKKPEKYRYYIKMFTFTNAEHKDFVKFFNKIKQNKLEQERNEALAECLPYWQEDINEAKRKSEEMLRKASETYQIYSTKFGY